MNSRVLLIVGLVLGAIVGYLTRPQEAEVNFGPYISRSRAITPLACVTRVV